MKKKRFQGFRMNSPKPEATCNSLCFLPAAPLGFLNVFPGASGIYLEPREAPQAEIEGGSGGGPEPPRENQYIENGTVGSTAAIAVQDPSQQASGVGGRGRRLVAASGVTTRSGAM